MELVTKGILSSILRRLAVFGTTLVPINIREESSRHTLDLDAATCYLSIRSYREWDEENMINFLSAELMIKMPLLHNQNLDSTVMVFPMEYLGDTGGGREGERTVTSKIRRSAGDKGRRAAH